MPEEIKDVTDSSPELEKALEGATPAPIQPTPEAETPTPKEGETQEQIEPQEEERVPYSRFKEKVDETNWYKRQLEAQLQRPQQQFPQPQPQDPYAGMTPEERVFWQSVDKRAEEKARQIVNTEIRPVIDAGRMEIARMSVAQFRQRYTDVKPNSPEEIAIAEKIQQGYVPDDAYRAVMWDAVMGRNTVKQQQTQQHKTEMKKKANVETGSITPSSTSKAKPFSRQSLDETLSKIEKGEI